MLAAVGDLVEDVVVAQTEPQHHASDTAARIARRRGGSASTVATVAARLGARARFIGQVGDDATGHALVDELAQEGVDVTPVRFGGVTGTIVVLLGEHGERSMFTDRRACAALDEPDPRWLEGVTTLHVPFYSLVGDPLSATATTLIGWAHDRGIDVSIDASSESVIHSIGAARAIDRVIDSRPGVVFANADEARALDIAAPLAGAITVIKRGPASAIVHRPGSTAIEVPADDLGPLDDTTGAGDAFAAGFLTYPDWRQDPVGACRAGHGAATRLLTGSFAVAGRTDGSAPRTTMVRGSSRTRA